jgi:hypothetical protein
MSTALEIDGALASLPSSHSAATLAWIDERHAKEVDSKFKPAILAGKLGDMAGRTSYASKAEISTPLFYQLSICSTIPAL